ATMSPICSSWARQSSPPWPATRPRPPSPPSPIAPPITSSASASGSARHELVSTDEVQDRGVEGVRLLPVRRMAGLGKNDKLRVRDVGRLPPHDPGRALEVL